MFNFNRLILFVLFFLSFPLKSFAGVNFAFIKNPLIPTYWTGAAGTGLWNNSANWSAGVVPGSKNLAIFDSTKCSGANCNVTINVAGISMVSGYTGTITHNSGITVIVGAWGWRQAAGTFTKSVSPVTINGGTFVLSGGTFNAGTGNFRINADPQGDVKVFDYTGGSFNPGTGTLIFGINGNGCINGTTYTIDFPTSMSVNNLTFNGGHATDANTCTWALGAGDTITVAGNYTIARDLAAGSVAATGTMDLMGNLTVGAGSAGGNLPINMNGAATQNITQTAGAIFHSGWFTIDKATGSVVTLSDITLPTSGFYVSQGTFDHQAFYVYSANVFSVNANATERSRYPGRISANVYSYTSGCNYELYGAGSTTFGWNSTPCNLIISKTGGAYVQLLTNTATQGNFINSAGSSFRNASFTLGVAGNFTNSGTWVTGTGTVSLTGTNQTITGNTAFYNLSKIASTARTLTFTAGSTQTITNQLTLKGTGAGSRLTLVSSSPGTPWNIDPQVNRDVQYVDVMDGNNTNGTAIPATTSVDSGNNTNWTITT